MTENNSTFALDKESWFLLGVSAFSVSAGFYDNKWTESIGVIYATSAVITASTWYFEERVPSMFEIMSQYYQPDDL